MTYRVQPVGIRNSGCDNLLAWQSAEHGDIIYVVFREQRDKGAMMTEEYYIINVRTGVVIEQGRIGLRFLEALKRWMDSPNGRRWLQGKMPI